MKRILTGTGQGHGNGRPPPAGGGGGGGSVQRYAVTSSTYAPLDGTTITITAQAKNSGNSNISAAGRTVTWSKSGTGGSFASPTSITNPSGVATVQFTVGAGGVTHTITATDTAAKTGTSSPIGVLSSTPTPVIDHYIVMPSDLAPLAGTTIAITAQAKDSGNTNVPEAGRVITWSKTGAGGSFSAATSVTDANGLATVDFTVGAGGVTHTVTATDGSAKTGTSSPILVQSSPPSPPTVDHYTVSASDYAPLDGTTIVITAQAKDSGNTNVAEAGRVVTWSKSGTGGSFAAATSVTDASGVATVNFTVGAGGVTHTVTGTDGSAKTGTTSPITVLASSPPSPTVDHYLVTPSNVSPLAGAAITITAQAKDSSNVNVAEAGRVVSWIKTGAGGSFSSQTSVTNANGVATVTFTVGAAGVTHTVNATDTEAATGWSPAIVVQTPSATVDHYLVTPSSTGPAAGTTIAITAQAKDASNVNVAEAGRTITWSRTGAGGTFSAPTSVTNSNGIATVLFTVGSVGATHTVTATDSVGKTGTSVSIFVIASGLTPPELPREFVDTTYPTKTGITRALAIGSDLQAAINAAQPGDEITLPQTATFALNYDLVTKSLAKYIVIRPAGGDIVPYGTRARPTTAVNFPKIVTTNVGAVFTAAGTSHHWWLSQLEITGTPQGGGVDYNYGLIRIGSGEEPSVAEQPHHIVLDRCYIHGRGHASGGTNVSVQHGVIINGNHLGVIDSWIEDIHWPGNETHAVAGYAGQGPFKIVNNALEAAGVNFIYGGAPAMAGVHPSDFELRRNHFFKPTSYFSQGFAVKNLLEWKHGQRIWVEGNVLENSWVDGQIGYLVNIQSGGDSGPLGTVLTCDVTFRYNIVRNGPIGFLLPANPYGSSLPVTRVAITHNLFDNIGPFGPNDSQAVGLYTLDNLSHCLIQHNSIFRIPGYGGAPVFCGTTTTTASNVVFIDNAMGDGSGLGTFFASGGYVGRLALDQWAGTTGWTCHHNLFWQSDEAPPDNRAVPGNTYAPSLAACQFAADRSLAPGSPYRNTASDGTDPGVNIPALTAATTGAIVAR